ncbi:acyltransferase family protein [Hymenobacter properus]|uniref:Acyltransferase n=1 Tax=Hymenobacter properus TaxID=2791026 RepID=A0A931BHL7_9BACT|nr:acyltransferase [Hymenobacter properus]MBF9142641.1 acyltransferase [Hymenobacter properus]MBR7721449.1 acyltransferase [Microvirga sp. SRT04]
MKTYFPALTGVRAVAAYMVVLVHFASVEASPTLPFFKMWVVQYLSQFGLGVVIFFVLSGFLITIRYAEGLELSWAWFRRYLQNRFARIYPIYFLLTAFTFGIMLLRPTHGWWEWTAAYSGPEKAAAVFLNLTLLRAYFGQFATLGVPTAWSLTVEETFYLCAPLLLLGFRRRPRGLVLVPVALLALGLALMAFCTRELPYYGLMQDARFVLGTTFFGRSAEFVWGMALGLWVVRQPRPLARRGHYTLLGAAGILLYMLATAIINHQCPTCFDSTGPDWYLVEMLAGSVVLPVFVCSLLWGLISEQTWLRWVLETKLLSLLGRASYVLYLLHLGTVDYLFRVYVSSNSLVCLLAYTLISIGLYQVVERPLQRWLRARPAVASAHA